MGCDGGTIPKRHELVKGPKKVEKVDKDAELVAQWNYCTLSQEILRRPIVACELGRLYNKDAVIEFLLDKSSEKALGKAASHIKSIKNVTELRLSDNPAWEGDKGNTKGDKHDDLQRARFICPVVGLEMNGRHRFCFLRCCGCVFSERALKEIKAEVCHTLECFLPSQRLGWSPEHLREKTGGHTVSRWKESPTSLRMPALVCTKDSSGGNLKGFSVVKKVLTHFSWTHCLHCLPGPIHLAIQA
ncbi:replication termination factor 2 isoform X3 [Odocoileus virginianus]|uniref:Replication termination factor 2 n=1 Tax=Odocoileus virginianus TaxID=9874 RepID=A0A6J0YII8_ODOVR|nr:protein RTF2 homolog isoform X3 [Odocoileus virginianus texanus]